MSNSVLMSGSIVHDYAEFSQQSVNDIVNKIVKFQELSIEDFKNSDSQFDFYANSKNYIYDLLGGHPDMDGPITEFARWRFKKYNVDVNMKIIPQDSFELTETYDFIYQDAVLEHLTPVQQVSYTSKLAKNLNLNGVFVMVVDLSGESENMPMHYNVDIVKVHKAIIDEGLTCYHGLNTFASVWMRTI